MPDKLRARTIGALFWSFLEHSCQNGMQFVIAVMLARLLTPAEFGLVAMLAIFMAVAQSLIDSGFGSALIQKQHTDHVDESSIFYFNILVSIFAAVILCLTAPWIGSFYSAPILVPIIRALSLNLFINAFGLVQTSLLIKRLDFKSQLKVSMVATVCSGVIGITMAYQGFGVWSLVSQSLTYNLFRTCLLWLFVRWRPAWTFSFAALRTMFNFGSKVLISGLLETFFQNIYLVVIGKFFSPADLGYYARAVSIQAAPIQTIMGTVSRVTYPVFSVIQDDKSRLRSAFRKALTTIAMLIFPLMIGLAIIANPLVLVLLSEKWLPCVPYLQLMCFVGILYPLHALNLNVLKAMGRSDLYLKLEIMKKILAVTALIITYRWGISAMIIGQIVTSFLCYYLNCYYTGKLLAYPMLAQLRDVGPVLLLSFVMGAVVYALTLCSVENKLILMIFQILTGVILYSACCRLFRISSYMEMIEVLKPHVMRSMPSAVE